MNTFELLLIALFNPLSLAIIFAAAYQIGKHRERERNRKRVMHIWRD